MHTPFLPSLSFAQKESPPHCRLESHAFSSARPPHSQGAPAQYDPPTLEGQQV